MDIRFHVSIAERNEREFEERYLHYIAYYLYVGKRIEYALDAPLCVYEEISKKKKYQII